MTRSETFDYSDCNYFEYTDGSSVPFDVCHTNFDGSSTYQSIIYTCEENGNAARLMFWYGDECYDGTPYSNILLNNSNYSSHCDGTKSSEECGIRIRTYQAGASDSDCDTSSDEYTEDIYVRGICNYHTLYPSDGAWIFSCDDDDSNAIYTYWNNNTNRCQSNDSTTIAMDTCEYNDDTNRYELIQLVTGCPSATTTTSPKTSTTSVTDVIGVTSVTDATTTTATENEKSGDGNSGEIDGAVVAVVIVILVFIVCMVAFLIYRRKKQDTTGKIQENLEAVTIQDAKDELVFVQIYHRHGDRAPLFLLDQLSIEESMWIPLIAKHYTNIHYDKQRKQVSYSKNEADLFTWQTINETLKFSQIVQLPNNLNPIIEGNASSSNSNSNSSDEKENMNNTASNVTRDNDHTNKWFGQFTDTGVKQLGLTGKAIRNRYIETLGFLPTNIRNSDQFKNIFFYQCDNEARNVYSAESLLYGLYPDYYNGENVDKLPLYIDYYHNYFSVFTSIPKNEKWETLMNQNGQLAVTKLLQPQLDQWRAKVLKKLNVRISCFSTLFLFDLVWLKQNNVFFWMETVPLKLMCFGFVCVTNTHSPRQVTK